MEAKDLGVALVRTGEALEAITRGEIDIQIATAKKYPRTLSKVRDEVAIMATQDQNTAEGCWYALPRGGKVIEGPSVRLAEIVQSAYGNIRTAGRVVGIEEQWVTVEGACHDLEKNVATTSQVRRRITDRNGRRYNEDMIIVTINAALSIAIRNAIFKVIPTAFLKPVFDKIKQVGMGEERTIVEHRKAMFAYFKGQGVSAERVLKAIGKVGEADVSLDDIATLKGLATALKEGTTTLEDAFPVEKPTTPLKAGRHEHKKKPPKPAQDGAASETQSQTEAERGAEQKAASVPPPEPPCPHKRGDIKWDDMAAAWVCTACGEAIADDAAKRLQLKRPQPPKPPKPTGAGDDMSIDELLLEIAPLMEELTFPEETDMFAKCHITQPLHRNLPESLAKLLGILRDRQAT